MQTITYLKSGVGRATIGPIKIDTYEYYDESYSSEETTAGKLVTETTYVKSSEETTPDSDEEIKNTETTPDKSCEISTPIDEEIPRFEPDIKKTFIKSDEISHADISEHIEPTESFMITAHVESCEDIVHPILNDETIQNDLIVDEIFNPNEESQIESNEFFENNEMPSVNLELSDGIIEYKSNETLTFIPLNEETVYIESNVALAQFEPHDEMFENFDFADPNSATQNAEGIENFDQELPNAEIFENFNFPETHSEIQNAEEIENFDFAEFNAAASHEEIGDVELNTETTCIDLNEASTIGTTPSKIINTPALAYTAAFAQKSTKSL